MDNETIQENTDAKECSQVLTPEKQIKKTNDTKTKEYNVPIIIITSCFLLGPILMGIAINSIGNDMPIKRSFAILHNYCTGSDCSNTDNITIMNNVAYYFPSELWSLGFLYPFGGWFGSIIGALTVDKYGRKIPSLAFTMLMILGTLLKIFSLYEHCALLFLGRFFDGVATSGLMVSALLLLFDSLPVKLEKMYKPFIQIGINFGILFIGVLSLNTVSGNNWNFIHISTLIISCILVVAILIHPESPKYVYGHTKDSNKTKKILMKLRGKCFDVDELDTLKRTIDENTNIQQMSIKEFLTEPRFRFPIASLIVLHLGQQLCGINAVVAFTPSILKEAKVENPDIYGTIILTVALGASLIFAPFVVNQRRKMLWLIGFFFQTFAFFCVLLCNSLMPSLPLLKVAFFGLFVTMFQIGPGPVVWFISIEMFPSNATGAAQGVAGFFNWFANTLVFLLFPILSNKLGINVLIIFIIFQIMTIIYSVLFVVETYNKTPSLVLDEYEKLSSKYKIFQSKAVSA